MMSIESVQAFLLFSFVAAITPGPSNMMLVAAGTQGGFRHGMPCLLGVATGMALLLACTSLAVGGALHLVQSDAFATVIRWAGAAILVWIAWQIGSADPCAAPTARKPVGFLAAAAFQWINPKSWVVATGAAAGQVEPDGLGLLLHAVGTGAMFFSVAMGAGSVWLVAGALLQQVLTDPAWARWFNISMAVLLVASVALSLR